MSAPFYYFNNYTPNVIRLKVNGKADFPIEPGTYISNSNANPDYVIVYESKEYPIPRSKINMLAPNSEYQFYITDSIELSNPLSNSTFINIDAQRPVTWLPATDSNVIYSPAQGLFITNATEDKSWTSSTNTPLYIWILIIFVIILFLAIIAIPVLYFFMKRST